MADFTTSQGRRVLHCHLGHTPQCEAAELSAAKINRHRNFLKQHHPNAVEVASPTATYNCIGYALARSHGFFLKYEEFFTDDYTEASFNSPAKGDVVRYNRNSGAFGHVAVVTRVGNGRIIRVRSKWGKMSELSHKLDDVDPEYGRPAALLRPRSGVVPLMGLVDDEEMPDHTGVARSVTLRGGEEMPEYESTEAAIHWALERISDPDVFIRVALASTPEMARVIIEALPGVKELIEIGAASAPAILSLLQRAEEQQETELSGIALYLLQRIPTEEAVQPLADSITGGRSTGINLSLAADALLTSAKIEMIEENPIKTALREAEKLKTPE